MTYTFVEFPKWVYSEIKKELIIVKDAIEEALHTAKAPAAPDPVPSAVVTEAPASVSAPAPTGFPFTKSKAADA